jgi:hypothetical protein
VYLEQRHRGHSRRREVAAHAHGSTGTEHKQGALVASARFEGDSLVVDKKNEHGRG